MRIRDIYDFEDLREAVMGWLFLILVGWLCGWIHAHSTVAKECERLGSFYVGSKVFHCSKIEDRQQ